MSSTPQDIFEQVGKRMPYRTPDGYFDHAAADLKKAVATQCPSIAQPHASRLRRYIWISSAAAVMLIAIAIYPIHQYLNKERTMANITPIYCETDNINDGWEEFANADIFLENMDW